MISEIEQTRICVAQGADRKKRARLGQFFTPATIARFMADSFARGHKRDCRLLDAGAGIGSLSAAFLERWADGGFSFRHVEVDAFEIDDSLLPYLAETVDKYGKRLNVALNVRHADFVRVAADWLGKDLFAETPPVYTHAILNPPYKKIRSDSEYRLALRRAGIETVNLYSAFVALALSLLEEGGEIVAIIPRSFCNGPYYRPFREYLLERSGIRHIHLFGSRSKAFKDDDVLQENVIIRLERGGKQGAVTVSISSDDSFNDLSSYDYPFDKIVSPDDPERFIHIPVAPEMTSIEASSAVRYSLSDIGIGVSTGPVVDFRLKEHLRDTAEAGTVPLLYPGHFSGHCIEWPKRGFKKPNAIAHNGDTERWLYPNGTYCVVRRFSSKEEKRRVVARVVDSAMFPGTAMLGFENHLNVFHEKKHGLPQPLAYGLSVYLNSTGVDEFFRRFNGHTQVNATDLKSMKYPSRDVLMGLGFWALRRKELTQAMIDHKVGSVTM